MSKGRGVHGIILAGGRARRLGGEGKALLPLGGRALIEHVRERFEPQVDSLALSVERFDPGLDYLGLPQHDDPQPGSNGPLGGLLSAMQSMPTGKRWLALVPCDAPFLPANLVETLLGRARQASMPGALVSIGEEWQPTFSLWDRELESLIEDAVLSRNLRGFKQFLRYRPLAVQDWLRMPGEPRPERSFLNINDPETLKRAEHILSEEGVSDADC